MTPVLIVSGKILQVLEKETMIGESYIKLGNTATEEQDIDGAVRNSICSWRTWAQ